MIDRRSRVWLRVVVPFCAGYFLSYLLRTVNAVISPELTNELGLSASGLGLLTSAYFLSFAAMQIPVGILLDRFGPRRVEAILLVVAAAGALLFGLSHSVATLTLSRALIGLGASACLMASLKGFSQWFGNERMAGLTGLVMSVGGLGAVTASVPLEHALPILGWRGAFFVLTGLLLVAAGVIGFGVIEAPHGTNRDSLRAQFRDLLTVVRSRQFRRFVPQAGFFVGSFMAMQGLWAVPWLINVDGYDRRAAADHLMWLNFAALFGQLTIAALATRLARAGVPTIRIMYGGQALSLLTQLLICAGVPASLPLWFAYGMFNTTGALMYSTLAAFYPLALAGRVMSTINLIAFVGAFSIQWGFGVLVDTLSAHGIATAAAYRLSFGLLILAQFAALLRLLSGGERRAASIVATP